MNEKTAIEEGLTTIFDLETVADYDDYPVVVEEEKVQAERDARLFDKPFRNLERVV